MRPPHTLLNESFRLQFPFVFRRLQSLQLLLPTHPCFLLSFLASLGFRFHGLSPLPLLFLTPAVFAPFRALQFWVLTTQPLFLPFRFLPVSASQWLPRCDPSAHASLAFPRSSQPGFPCFRSRFFVLGFLFVSFHPSRFRSHSRSTGASLRFHFRFSSGLFCWLSAFFRLLLPASDYSAFCSFLSLLPDLPWQRFSRCASVPFVPDLSSSVSPVSMRPFRFRYSASCVSVLRFTVSCHRHYAASGLLFPARPFPFAFALGSGYLACPLRTFWFAANPAYITTATIICQYLFLYFFNNFLYFLSLVALIFWMFSTEIHKSAYDKQFHC